MWLNAYKICCGLLNGRRILIPLHIARSFFFLFSPFSSQSNILFDLLARFYFLPFSPFSSQSNISFDLGFRKNQKNYKTAHDRCLREIFQKKKMLSPLAPRSRNECLSLILLLLSFFSAFLSHADAHSWVEAVTYVRDNTPFGKIGYARGNGPQFPSPPYK